MPWRLLPQPFKEGLLKDLQIKKKYSNKQTKADTSNESRAFPSFVLFFFSCAVPTYPNSGVRGMCKPASFPWSSRHDTLDGACACACEAPERSGNDAFEPVLEPTCVLLCRWKRHKSAYQLTLSFERGYQKKKRMNFSYLRSSELSNNFTDNNAHTHTKKGETCCSLCDVIRSKTLRFPCTSLLGGIMNDALRK